MSPHALFSLSRLSPLIFFRRYKMVAAGTVDEKILTKADKKTKVNSALLDGNSSAGSSKGNGQDERLSSVSGILADALRTYLN